MVSPRDLHEDQRNKVMATKKTRTGWLAVGSDGSWGLDGWSEASNGNKPNGDSARNALEAIEAPALSLHRVTFELPDLPRVQGEDAEAVTVGSAE